MFMNEKIETVYTKGGRCGKLIRKEADNKFLIQLYMNYAEWVGDSEYGEVDSYSELSENMIYTDVIYHTPPTELIDPKIIELRETVKSLSEQKAELIAEINKQKYELKQTQTFTTDLKRWQFDVSQFRNAKKVAMFIKGVIKPLIVDMPTYKSNFERISLTIKISLDGKYGSYMHRYFDWDSNHTHDAEHIDENYGYMFDIDDDELTHITLERSETLPLDTIDNWKNGKGGMPEKYMSQRFKDYLAQREVKQKEQVTNQLKEKIAAQQLELEKLTQQ